MAASSNLDYERSSYEPEIERSSSLTRLKVTMNLAGSYADVRDFIHEIETSPEFVVIDSIGLAEGVAGDETLRLTLELSTFFRNAER
jgi:Tfp pilus assembly protein PilO